MPPGCALTGAGVVAAVATALRVCPGELAFAWIAVLCGFGELAGDEVAAGVSPGVIELAGAAVGSSAAVTAVVSALAGAPNSGLCSTLTSFWSL